MDKITELAGAIFEEIRTEEDMQALLDRVAVEYDRDGEIALPGDRYASGATQAEIDADRKVSAALRAWLRPGA